MIQAAECSSTDQLPTTERYRATQFTLDKVLTLVVWLSCSGSPSIARQWYRNQGHNMDSLPLVTMCIVLVWNNDKVIYLLFRADNFRGFFVKNNMIKKGTLSYISNLIIFYFRSLVLQSIFWTNQHKHLWSALINCLTLSLGYREKVSAAAWNWGLSFSTKFRWSLSSYHNPAFHCPVVCWPPLYCT